MAYRRAGGYKQFSEDLTTNLRDMIVSMTDTIKMPTVPTDKMIRAAQHGCGLTPIEAVHVYQTMNAAYEAGDGTAIFNSLLDKKTDAIKQTAILAAEAVDIRAGNAVRKALEQ